MSHAAKCQDRLDNLQTSHSHPDTQSKLAVQRLNTELARLRRNEQTIRGAMTRAKEQRWIMQCKVDQESLTIALRAFRNLQQIRLMRNVDDLDRDWRRFLESRSDLRGEFGMSQWTVACENATMVLARAYSASKSNAHRLSSRFMDPHPMWLQDHVCKAKISTLSTRLTCLELQIGDPSDLNKKMNDLSSVFRELFQAAEKMEGLHIGLLREISIPLETIFHNVAWTNLVYIGFSRWNFRSDEIIGFIRRHSGSLTSVRFREVRLRDGSWIEIVKFLRRELKLEWASFRQVGYDPFVGGGPVPERAPPGGFAMLRGSPMDDDESYSSGGSDDIGEHVGLDNGRARATDSEETTLSDDDESVGGNNDSDATVEGVALGINDTIELIGDGEEAISSNNGEVAGPIHGDYGVESEDSPPSSIAGDSEVGANEVALDDQIMVQHSTATDNRPQVCHCRHGYHWDDLQHDNGLDPTKAQWKWWERWVKWGCVEHDPT